MSLSKTLSTGDIAKLRHLVDEANKVVIVCHRNPDGDAVGSMVAMTLLMRRMGKQATAIVPNNFPDFLKWLPTSREILLGDRQHKRVDEALAEANLVMMLDFNTPSRMTELLMEKVMACNAPRVMMDHHLNPDAECELIVSRPKMCSTCEVLFRVMLDMGWNQGMTPAEATALYTGMMTDTGAFTYASNRPAIFEAVSLLLSTGIDKDRIYRNVFFSHTEGRFRLMGYLLYEKMEVMPELHTTLITMTNEERNRFHTKNGATEGFVNIPLEMQGMKLSIFLREDTEQEGLIRVSTRSLDDFPCNEMCQEFFNGGGHKNASGGNLRMTMDEAVAVVHQALEKYSEMLKDDKVEN